MENRKKNKKAKFTTFKHFYKRLYEEENIRKAWNAVYANCTSSPSLRTRNDAKDFKSQEVVNLKRLKDSLASKKFNFSVKAIPQERLGKDPRPLVNITIEGRIVQRCILNVLQSHSGIKKYMHNNPFSFGGIKHREVKDAVEAVIRTSSEKGYTHFLTSDIGDFFTRIKSDIVIGKIKEFCKADQDFINILQKAIHLEIENMKEIEKKYPKILYKYNYTDEGVPQGSCLSPLFGNMYLYEFDKIMNSSSDVSCFRYIDDIIIIGNSFKNVENSFHKKALPILEKLGLTAYIPGKSNKAAHGELDSSSGFNYLGVNITKNQIKPSKDAFEKIIKEIKDLILEALNFDAIKPVSLYKTLDLIDRKLKGWGNHYSFCNAKVEMNVLDITMDKLLSEFIEKYNKKLAKLKPSHIREKIGIQRVTNCKHDPIIK